MNQLYDLAIIGGGPAGVAAGVYASRKRLKTVFITKDWGGQSIVSTEIQNWIGTVAVSGFNLAEMLKRHLMAYASDIVDIKDGEMVKKVLNSSFHKGGGRVGEAGGFIIKTDANEYEARTVLIAAGSHRRKLAVPNADKFEHNGITYCASCDGPLFADLPVAVIGGGNAGFETAAQLLAYCKTVTILNRSNKFKADPITVKKVLENPKMHSLLNVDILEVLGEKNVTGLVYQKKGTSEKVTLPVQGVFVEIGSIPSTESVADLVERDQYNHVIVDPKNQRTSLEGIWAAGDCTNGLYHQNNIAAGDAVKALEDIYLYLHAK